MGFAQGVAREPDRGADQIARLASLWAERRDPTKADEALRLATAALAERPDAPDRMFWKARLLLWVGDSLTDPKERKRLGREAWDLGDRLARAKPEWVAGHYFGAVGIGLYCSGAGILSALAEGLDSKFNDRLERALALDPPSRRGTRQGHRAPGGPRHGGQRRAVSVPLYGPQWA